MNNLQGFKVDWNQDFSSNDFKPLAAGEYGAKITKSELKTTKAGDQAVNLEFTLLGGKGVKGRKVFELCLLEHSKPIVVKIGLGKLKALADATGINYDEIVDTSVFNGQLVGLALTVEENEEFGDKNRIKKFLEFDESMTENTDTGTDVF